MMAVLRVIGWVVLCALAAIAVFVILVTVILWSTRGVEA